MSRLMTKPTKWLCAQRRLRSAWASAQCDQSLSCALNGQLRTQAFFMRTAKTLIRLGECPGWSESSLSAQIILLVLSWGGSIIIQVNTSGALPFTSLTTDILQTKIEYKKVTSPKPNLVALGYLLRGASQLYNVNMDSYKLFMCYIVTYFWNFPRK